MCIYIYIYICVCRSICLLRLAHGLLSCVSAVFGVCSSGLWGGGVGGVGGGGGGSQPSSCYFRSSRTRLLGLEVQLCLSVLGYALPHFWRRSAISWCSSSLAFLRFQLCVASRMLPIKNCRKPTASFVFQSMRHLQRPWFPASCWAQGSTGFSLGNGWRGSRRTCVVSLSR